MRSYGSPFDNPFVSREGSAARSLAALALLKLTPHLLAAGAIFGFALSSALGASLDNLQGYYTYTFEGQNNGLATNAARRAGFLADSAMLHPLGVLPLTTSGSTTSAQFLTTVLMGDRPAPVNCYS